MPKKPFHHLWNPLVLSPTQNLSLFSLSLPLSLSLKGKEKRSCLIEHCRALLAASGHNRCTSLVCSCYEASRSSSSSSDYKTDHQKHNTSSNSYNIKIKENKNGFKERFGYGHHDDDHHHINLTPLKSNLKKKKNTITSLEGMNQHRVARKVHWPDDHGEDIAHVQLFHPSVPREGKLEGVENSCVCAIL